MLIYKFNSVAANNIFNTFLGGLKFHPTESLICLVHQIAWIENNQGLSRREDLIPPQHPS